MRENKGSGLKRSYLKALRVSSVSGGGAVTVGAAVGLLLGGPVGLAAGAAAGSGLAAGRAALLRHSRLSPRKAEIAKFAVTLVEKTAGGEIVWSKRNFSDFTSTAGGLSVTIYGGLEWWDPIELQASDNGTKLFSTHSPRLELKLLHGAAKQQWRRGAKTRKLEAQRQAGAQATQANKVLKDSINRAIDSLDR